MTEMEAPGRLPGSPVAIVDIGSNSVRIVAYEALSRAPTPTFNEKAMCGLGRGVATEKRLRPDAVEKALTALRRFRVLCLTMGISDVRAIATAAVRDASDGELFLKRAETAIGREISLIDGQREARLAALGVLSGVHAPDGVVGDLGGGSLELTELSAAGVGEGVTTPLGGLALMDASEHSPKRAVKIVRDALERATPLAQLAGRTFYAVGGTWRALARLHMRQRRYPLHVMHNYVIPTRDAFEFAGLVERVDAEALSSIEAVASARRPLLAYGAVVLEEIIRTAAPKEIVVSALGVREGLLFEALSEDERAQDPLIFAAAQFNRLRSRAPQHGVELFAWTDALIESSHLGETAEEVRLRRAVCLLSDISWRAHPDYRGEQAYNLISSSAYIGIDHPGRAFLALASAYRHISIENDLRTNLVSLLSARQLDRARILGAAMRVAFIISTGMSGVLPRSPMFVEGGKVVIALPRDLADLAGDRLQSRLKQFARLLGGDPEIRIGA